MKKKVKNGIAWFLQVIMGLEFILAGQAKFTRAEVWQRQFREWGYPDHVYLIIGGLELLGAVLIFFPKLASKAAIGLGVIMIGAVVTHGIYGEWSRVMVTLILAALLFVVFWLRRSAIKQGE